MAGNRRLLILGPSFSRNKSSEFIPAVARYDGLFFRVARKYLSNVKEIDIIVMIDDLTLIEGKTPLPFREPVGEHWGKQTFSQRVVEQAKLKNKDFLDTKFKNETYSEVFIAMGKNYAKALPDLSEYNLEVIFPATGGPGPKAQALKNWIIGNKDIH